MPDTKPNLLIIISDQHSPFVTGCYGNRHVHTPNIDALAGEGVLFESAYCASPLCVPSRLSMLTGRHPHRIGVWGLADTIRSDTPTWPIPLTIAGWHTVLSGRMHLVWPDRNHGFETRLCGDAYPTIKNHFAYWEKKNPPVFDSRSGLREACIGNSRQDAEDDIAQGAAIKFLHQTVQQNSRRPFALCVGFARPHPPFRASKELYDLYASFEPDLDHTLRVRPEFYRLLADYLGLEADPPGEAECIRAIRFYYAMVTAMDRRVGALCETLKHLGLWENTIVIYTSDHGESLGSHGLWFKSSFYEESVRVPLIVRYPERFRSGIRVETPVSLLDLFPTVCELAGETPYSFLDGKSLVPALQGEDMPTDRPIFAEYADYGIPAPMRMVRRERYKLMYASGFDPVLYDLKNDPHENHNLVGKPLHTNTVADLLSLITEDWRPDSVRRQVLQNQENRDLFLAAEEAIRKATGKEGFPWGT